MWRHLHVSRMYDRNGLDPSGVRPPQSIRHWSIEVSGLPIILQPSQNQYVIEGITAACEDNFGPVAMVTVGYVWSNPTDGSGASSGTESRLAKRSLEEERILLPLKHQGDQSLILKDQQRIDVELARLDAESHANGCTGHAFVVFEDESGVIKARNATENYIPCEISNCNLKPFLLNIHPVAPHPTDVLWDNLQYNTCQRLLRYLVVMVVSSVVLAGGLVSLIFAVGTSNSGASTGTNAAANILLIASYLFVCEIPLHTPEFFASDCALFLVSHRHRFLY